MTTTTYPVHVDAHLDPRVSRGLWLVKWILAIPHYVVLAFLWVAFVVTSVVAFLAILVTGRYPRAVFDFNVGVLRWTWRVGYYAYGALGTDRYPPFSLHERADYPAHLEVDYPEQLSRGLVLVKWWLLALPHYLVVGILLSGGLTVAGEIDGGDQWMAGTGLIGLLVLIAAVVLLVTGRYPQPLFDLVLGLNRWVLRVAAYAGLMTDRYPPFRLDQGGHEDGAGCLVLSPDSEPASSAPLRTSWGAGRVTALVVASLLLLASAAVLVGGAMAAWADNALRDDAGYVMSDDREVTSPTYAITSEPLEVHLDGAAGVLPEDLLGRARLTASAPQGNSLFLGVAPTASVDRFLSGVATDRLTDLSAGPAYTRTDGGPPPARPQDVDIWRAAGTGTGEVRLTWPVEDGEWTVVVMNADGTRGVDADVAAGATLPFLDDATPVLLWVGGVGLLVGLVVLGSTITTAGRPGDTAR